MGDVAMSRIRLVVSIEVDDEAVTRAAEHYNYPDATALMCGEMTTHLEGLDYVRSVVVTVGGGDAA
jgi:hypothetical protein